MTRNCPYCKRPLERADRFCPACTVEIQDVGTDVAAVHPSIVPGAVIARGDFSVAPPPNRDARSGRLSEGDWFEPHPQGVVFGFQNNSTQAMLDRTQTLRDACVRATFTPLTPGVRMGISARTSTLGKAFLTYTLEVDVDGQSVWPSMLFEGERLFASATVLHTPVRVSSIGVGVASTIELRVQGPSLQALVNGVPVLSIHDPTYGGGLFGIRVGRSAVANGTPTHVLAHGYEIAGVGR